MIVASSVHAQDEDGQADFHADLGFFQTSDRCVACHSGMKTSSGADVSIGYSWRASMMANSARDPYWHAAVRREVMDHPAAQAAIEDKCSTCHMPMHRFNAASQGGQGRVFANVVNLQTTPFALASDGVSCTVCHQIEDGNFGERSSFEGGFEIDTARPAGQRSVFGPHAVDAGRERVMQSAAEVAPTESTHLAESELCATCHTLYTASLDAAGNQIGELAEQMPYPEWRHSAYRSTTSCQDCHMPELTEETAISSVLGQARPRFSQHVFRGGNAFMLGLLNKHRGELGVQALPQELDAAVRRTIEYLSSASARIDFESVRVAADTLVADLTISNLAGHKLPTAYPSRRAWLHVRVMDGSGRTVFESGAVAADGSIVGNDNDADALRYEPHYEVIERSDQVQIYEPILAGPDGQVTTGLLSAVTYVKDNRLLPTGFDKRTATEDIGVFGSAADDEDFIGGGDRVRYRVPLEGRSGPFEIQARLVYQSIGFRWAANLGGYDAAETNRFVAYYEGSAGTSSVELAAARATIER